MKHYFSKNLGGGIDKGQNSCYNSTVQINETQFGAGSLPLASSRNRKLSCGDEESTVQIRRNSHCRYGRKPPVGMLIVLCCKVSPGIWGVWRFASSVPMLVFCRTPQNGFPFGGCFCFRLIVGKCESSEPALKHCFLRFRYLSLLQSPHLAASAKHQNHQKSKA